MLHENEWHREERSMEQHGTLPSFPTDVSMDLSKWHLPPKMVCWCDVSTNIVHHCSLPETSSLPCAKDFAVCQNSGTRQTFPLPCANRKSTRQTFGTRQTFSLPCVRTKNTRQSPNAWQRCSFAVCCQIKHTAKNPFLPCA